MNRSQLRWLALALLPVLAVPACLSSSDPPPPVRYFDPSTRSDEGPPRPAVSCDLRVTAATHLGREFVVRVAAHEVVFDGLNSWIADPRDLVQAAVERRLGPCVRSPEAMSLAIDVEAFELDVQAQPQARVRLAVRAATGSRTIDVVVPAADRSPASFAVAMAAALDQVAAMVSEPQGPASSSKAGER
ncbi:MAG TPA: hypothetical protein VF384_01105 [Planctomycetota bacterium]